MPLTPERQSVVPNLKLSEFEAAVLASIASGSDDSALQTQLAHAEVVSRDYTVVGCYTKLLLPSQCPASSASYAGRGPLPGPLFESPAVEHGGGTLLWFADGLAECIEIYVYGDFFPEVHADLGKFRLSGGA